MSPTALLVHCYLANFTRLPGRGASLADQVLIVEQKAGDRGFRSAASSSHEVFG